MKATISIQNVRNLNNGQKAEAKTLGGCISQILANGYKGETAEEQSIVKYLVKVKADKSGEMYQKLLSEVKPSKTGSFGRYNTFLAVKRLINS